jgi:flagellar protein FliO/FliZ
MKVMITRRFFLTATFLFAQVALGENLPAKPQSVLQHSPAGKESSKSPAESAAVKQTAAVTLGAVTTEVEGDLTIVTARLNRSPQWKNIEIEEHGTFLQIKLPQTLIPASGEFLDGNGPFLRKLASFQVGSDDGALRLFINQDASKAKLATSAELLGDRIVVTIDHKKLEQLITPAQKTTTPETAVAPNDKSSAPEVVTAAQPLSAPAEATINTNVTENRQLHAQLTKGAGICALLFMCLLAVQFLKSRRGRAKNQIKNAPQIEPVTMRVLSSISLGQKQKLTLVQVGSQQILLGLTPDNINLLTNIDDKNSHAGFARALETANPNAEVRLKNPGEIASVQARKTLTAPAVKSRSIANNRGSNINIAIGEDGPVDLKSSKSEDDITKILRDRLRNLPPG